MAREAVRMFAEARSPNMAGDVWMHLAQVLQTAGKTDEAIEGAEAALEQYERKGNEPACASIHAYIGSLADT